MSEITREVMEEALEFLAATDYEYARLKALYNGLTQQKPTIKAQAFMQTREGPQTQKEHQASMSFLYTEHLKKIECVELEMLTVQNQRATKIVLIDCWRSLNAARSRGQIV